MSLQMMEPERTQSMNPESLQKQNPERTQSMNPESLQKQNPERTQSMNPESLQKQNLERIQSLKPESLQKTKPEQFRMKKFPKRLEVLRFSMMNTMISRQSAPSHLTLTEVSFSAGRVCSQKQLEKGR